MTLLDKYLRNQLLPWSENMKKQRFILARLKMNRNHVPEGVTLVPHKIRGKKVIVKNRRFYGNIRNHLARWPEAGLDELVNYNMLVVLEGSADIQIGHQRVLCPKGYYLIIEPGTPQPGGRTSFFHAEHSSCTVLQVVLHPYAIQCVLHYSDNIQRKITMLENYLFKNEHLTGIFLYLMEELLAGNKNAQGIGSNLLNAFWTILQRETEDKRYVNPGPVGRPASPQLEQGDFINELTNYIQSHINDQLTLESVARGLHLSRTLLIRRVRRETGKSFVQFLNDYRITEAKMLLLHSDWTIDAISGFLGFKSPSHFHHVFKRYTLQTPGQYRTTNR